MTPRTQAWVRYIRAELAKGRMVKDIAASLGVTPSYVSQLKRQHIDLLDRWLNVHKIGDIGKRAVEETA